MDVVEAREKMIARRFGGVQQSRTGGKGTVRRKKKTMHKTATSDDKKLGSTLKKLGVTNIPAIEEVNLFAVDGKVIHFSNPKVQASIAANTYVISGPNDVKQLTELLPGIMNQLGPDNMDHLKQIADNMTTTKMVSSSEIEAEEDDDVPDLIENFEDVSKL
mmetsp:Transcript_2615/g.6751  ORF Transcript_2615/g.6751 Transcript_2615/m.6751 type:complete len:161 (+) Transcript_2615:103-585(+)|eukprot:CAMPEP_0197416332 /NCGR_PEP_ID=MMETSP1170-20131217/2657_1 /TAXON_ID=54406 /ORGANISM="Sarcinochrysis sp, Strain CCMP770" /LENGTH=160 /DNA_ID=CAMNT_0042943221 /DNA_START=70 /DNA_END=552 /DNA_ORIENTATION=-